jgi:predicted  nucleic acid-binding Zn-ribbon protein
MQANFEDLETLIEVQQLDLNLLHLRKAFDELPQRTQILDARKKRSQLEGKLQQIESIKKDTSKKLIKINDEDTSLIKKENAVQAAIEASGRDFRNVEVRTRELDGIAKRRTQLAKDRAQIDEQLEKIFTLHEQVCAAISEVDALEAKLTAEFQQDGSKLQNAIAEGEVKRAEIMASVEPGLASVFNKVAKRTGNVALGKLNGNQCGVCRAIFESGRLIDLKSQAPLGKCPTCGRLLIIE